MKKKFYLIFIFLFIFILLFYSNVFAAWGEPKLISTLNNAFETIEEWLIKLSTPAAAVAVGTGVFMKKFSFGDEERMRVGKKLIKGSLFSYAFILVLNLVLSAIQSLLA